MRSLLATMVLVALSALPALGQSVLTPGARVRVTAPDYGLDRHVGVLLRLDATTITVDSVEIARDRVSRLDIHRGTHGHAGPGAIWGGLIGGVLLGVSAAALCTDPFFDCNPGAGFAGGFVIGAVPGALIGALIGSFIRSDRWEERTVAVARPTAAIAPGRGVSLGMSVSF